MLTPQDEARAVIEVTERLALSFPEVNAADVERAVRRSYEQFTGSRFETSCRFSLSASRI